MAIIRKYFEVEGQLIVGDFSVNEAGDIVTNGGYYANSFDFNDGLFYIDGDNGNTTIGGTLHTSAKSTLHSLEVLHSTTLDEDVTIGGDLAVNGGDLTTNKTTFNLINTVTTTLNIGGYASTINLGRSGDHWVNFKSNVNVDRNLSVAYQFEVAEGKFQFDGTYADQGATRLQGILEVGQDVLFESGLTVDGSTTLHATSLSGDLAINTNKFNVAHTTGNTSIAGTLDVTGNLTVNTNKFSVTASSGNTSIAGTLGVTGNTTLGGTLSVTGNTTLTGTLSSGNLTTADITANGIESSAALTKIKSTNLEI